MFSLLSATLRNAINRFLTFELGKGDSQKLKRVFSTSLNVMLVLSLVIMVLGATFGVWFLNAKMNIPESRMSAANVVLACSLLTFVMNLVSVPYSSAIVAHEKMSAFAYISLVEALVKLAIVYALYVIPFDKLKIYAVLLFVLSLLVRSLYVVYCKKHFEECRYQFVHDKELLKEMTSFAGWNFIAGSASIINGHGVNIVMNLFFGVSVNAARGIASQVTVHIHRFVSNFMTAVKPQITKSYAQEDYSYMHSLVCRSSKFSYFLMLFFVLPLCLETRQILSIWLGTVPEYAVGFVRMALVITTLNTLSESLIAGLHATGNIRRYMIVVGLVELTCFPITYFAFRFGASPYVAYYINFLVYFILMLLRLCLVKGLIRMRAAVFIKEVYLKVLSVSVLASVLPVVICSMQDETLIRFFSVCLVSCVSTLVSVYFVGLDVYERAVVVQLVRKKIGKR